MKSIFFLFSLLVPLLTASLSGCSGSGAKPTFGGWQNTIQNHVRTRGGGDINSLRNGDSEIFPNAFNVIGDEKPETSADINGILLGHLNFNHQDWYVFIVGYVKAGDVKDIRVAAVTEGKTDLLWQFGNEDSRLTQAYREAKLRGRGRGQSVPIAFPLEEDDFDLSVAGDIVAVSERTSQVRWTLQPDPAR